MLEVIDRPEDGVVLIPIKLCKGLSFNGLKYKQVPYRYNTYIITERNLEISRRLAAAGIVVESGILTDYHWPSKYPTPYEHQKISADFLVRNPRAFCFNDIGTSKTLTTLWACDYLMRKGEMGKVLVASTLSTLQRVWEHEIYSNAMGRTSAVLHGSPDLRRRRLAEDVDFYIINHEGLKVLSADLIARHDITHVIIDEGARFRNQRTDLWKAAQAVCGTQTGRSVWWLTGSPMPRAPTDVWAQAKIVNPTTVPKFFTRFRDQTMHKITNFKWVPRSGWERIVYASVQPSIRYKREDCLDLPECLFVDHHVEMSKEQQKYYKQLEETLAIEIREGLITATNEGAKLIKLLQIACGAIYDSQGFEHYIDTSPKFNELADIIEEVGDKLIIFVPFKHCITMIAEWFEAKQKHLSIGVVSGAVGKGARDRIFKSFQAENLNVIIAQPASMAHGLTLTASNTIVWWSPVDNFEIYEQSIGRITRPGQERRQYIKHLICSKVEKAVYKRNQTKESMQGILFELIDEEVA